MGRVRETLVQIGDKIGFHTETVRIGDKRISFKKIRFKDSKSFKVEILPAVTSEPPEAISNLPDHLPVCSEGCDTYIMFPEEEGGDLPCGKCGAVMKPKKEVY